MRLCVSVPPAPHSGGPAITAHVPNELWTADFKGQFRLRPGSYCYPLTVADRFSRYLLACAGGLSHGGMLASAILLLALGGMAVRRQRRWT